MDFFIGSIALFPYSFVPRGWLRCDGSTLPISAFQELFSLIGNRYGGDGIQTFNLPDLSGAKPNEYISYFIAVEGVYPPRS